MRQTQTPEGKSVRLLRIGEQVRHVLAGVLGRGEVRDPVLESHIVSVSEVRVSPDLRIATAFVKALGGDDDEVLAALRRNAKFLRGEVARSMTTKYTPELKFRLDESYEEASRIDALLRDPKVARDLED
ncbi:30S ribosome-binding factor RbfA [Sphingosinicella microcystinivorans]|uniref:30S ribosome-binding factor RbfA n=1 Tax=Sphingosinicella microcystinivorans TaxID=335406 RepID=UPI001C6CF36D|nr:30S ribosome-binding factor RbfA [Sphingosinicella microcystinivorans]MBW7945946.1 30S ribosome-binding factor RbfA [Sphingomonadaceae bacterium]WBX84822.1 30S ribosome-binding factor RbfA [Sphingosinicella microcystinivorans]